MSRKKEKRGKRKKGSGVSFVVGVLVLVLLVVGFVVFGDKGDSDVSLSVSGVDENDDVVSGGLDGGSEFVDEVVEAVPDNSGVGDDVFIRFVDEEVGFSPRLLEVQVGQKVIFENAMKSGGVWPASDVHPTHRLYPGSDIGKCGTNVDIFDACRGLESGESWSFVFNEKGEWGYHDHLSSKYTGTIVVKEFAE